MATAGTRSFLPLILLSSVLHAAPATPAGSDKPTRSSEQNVRDFESEVFSAYNQTDAARAAHHYAKDAWVFIPGQPSVRGREAIGANIARFMKDPNFKLGYTNGVVSVSASNDLAYTRGRLQVTYTDPKTQAARTITSNYMLVMRRDAEAGWQIVEDISF